MGAISTPGSGLADALFSSVQQRVLAVLFGNPASDFSTSEVIRRVGGGTGAVHRELMRLAGSGILAVEKVGNQKRYRANASSPIFDELRGLIVKTVGLVGPIRHALAPSAAHIGVAFVYGSVARAQDRAASDIDLMIIAEDISHTDAYASLAAAEKALGRTIEPTVMSPAEWRGRLAEDGSFVSRIARQPKLFVIGTADDLDRIAEPGADRPAQA